MVKDCASFKVPSIIYILGTRSLVDYRGTITFAGKIPFRCKVGIFHSYHYRSGKKRNN